MAAVDSYMTILSDHMKTVSTFVERSTTKIESCRQREDAKMNEMITHTYQKNENKRKCNELIREVGELQSRISGFKEDIDSASKTYEAESKTLDSIIAERTKWERSVSEVRSLPFRVTISGLIAGTTKMDVACEQYANEEVKGVLNSLFSSVNNNVRTSECSVNDRVGKDVDTTAKTAKVTSQSDNRNKETKTHQKSRKKSIPVNHHSKPYDHSNVSEPIKVSKRGPFFGNTIKGIRSNHELVNESHKECLNKKTPVIVSDMLA